MPNGSQYIYVLCWKDDRKPKTNFKPISDKFHTESGPCKDHMNRLNYERVELFEVPFFNLKLAVKRYKAD